MRKAVVAAVMAVAAGIAAEAIAEAPKAFWEGQSGGYRIRWTRGDLTAQGQPNFALRPIAQAGYVAVKPERGCLYERAFRLLSVVGRYVSLRDEESLTCPNAAHPSSEHRLTTIDLARPAADVYAPTEEEPLKAKGAVKLTDLFAESDVVAALLRDPVIRKGVTGAPTTAAALQAAFPEGGVPAGSTPCHFRLEPDFLTRFAFHHVEGESVAVRLAMSPLGGACRGAEAELGLLLPIPPALKEPLAAARLAKQGFLMEKAPKGETKIEFKRK